MLMENLNKPDTNRIALIDSFENLEEARECADRALIRRYLMQGTPVRRLNNEANRPVYMHEEANQLLSRRRHVPPTARGQLVDWFLYQPELAYLITSSSDPVFDDEIPLEEIVSFQELMNSAL